jgi:hypothetical protein
MTPTKMVSKTATDACSAPRKGISNSWVAWPIVSELRGGGQERQDEYEITAYAQRERLMQDTQGLGRSNAVVKIEIKQEEREVKISTR